MSDVDATVVITTKDRPELVAAAVDSALAQTLPSVEVIVVDDGSDPPFRAHTDDPRLRLIRHERPRGPCAARNAALTVAEGRWITFLDDDDQLLPDMLRRGIGAAESSPLPRPVAVMTAIEVFDPERGEVLDVRRAIRLERGRDSFLEDVQGTFQTQNSLIVETDLFRAIGGWDERLRASEHDDLMLRVNHAASLETVDEPLYRMRAHQDTRLSRSPIHRAEAMDLTFRTHREAFRRHRRRAARYVGAMGITYLRAGRWGRAVGATSRALVLDPFRGRAWAWWLASLLGPRLVERIRILRGGR